MRRLKVTAETLVGFGACSGAVRRFREQYPRGLVVTDDQLANFEILSARIGESTIRWGDADTWGFTGEWEVAADARWLTERLIATDRSERVSFSDSASAYYEGGLFLVAGVLAEAVAAHLTR